MAVTNSRRRGDLRVRRYTCRACGVHRYAREVEIDPKIGRRVLYLLEKASKRGGRGEAA
jgi:hypothetical protein